MNTLQAINTIYSNNPPRHSEIAKALGVSRQRLSNWVLEKYEPDLRLVRKMLHGDQVQRAFASAILDIHDQSENAQMPQDGLGTPVLSSHDETGVACAQRSGQEQPGGKAANLEDGVAAIFTLHEANDVSLELIENE